MKRYWPLILVILFSSAGGVALLGITYSRSLMNWMINFSAFFFLFLSFFKLLDLKGFSDGFKQYDLLAEKSEFYSYLYPFLELAIALGFFARVFIVGIAIFTAILMIFGVLGVINAVFQKKQLRCACMGTKLNLPLTTVSIVENIAMGIMSIFITINSF